MIRFVVRRLLWMVPVLFTVTLITFLLMHAAPGGPWDRDPGRRQIDAATQAKLDHQFGLDKPMWRQFVAYVLGDVDDEGQLVCGAICGNLGPSYRQRGRTVQEILFGVPEGKQFWQSRFGYSVRLGMLALVFAVVVGVPSGVVAALWQNSWIDYVSALVANIGVSVPGFVIGIYLIIIFIPINICLIRNNCIGTHSIINFNLECDYNTTVSIDVSIPIYFIIRCVKIDITGICCCRTWNILCVFRDKIFRCFVN